jgi:hypothetical protein
MDHGEAGRRGTAALEDDDDDGDDSSYGGSRGTWAR